MFVERIVERRPRAAAQFHRSIQPSGNQARSRTPAEAPGFRLAPTVELRYMTSTYKEASGCRPGPRGEHRYMNPGDNLHRPTVLASAAAKPVVGSMPTAVPLLQTQRLLLSSETEDLS